MSAVESLGKYEIRRQLGRGAMGTVYEGFDPIIERTVAIKTVRLPEAGDDEIAEEIARFRREAQAAGRLTHPNIVGVFDYGETADLAYIVMEYVDGPPLKSLLDKNERFPLPRIVGIMEDLLTGLRYSHERGVVHRDIKPANLMLTKSGQAKIADFGIARIESSSMTQAGTVLGTPAYMSPEQFMGQVVDARTDIYSSGVLLYQLLTGERPFEGSMSAIMHKALHTEAPLPSQISVTAPRSFDAVVKRAMAKRPADRYSSAEEFLAAIRTAVAAPPSSADAPDDGQATMILSLPPDGSAPQSASRGTPPAGIDAGRRRSSKLPVIMTAGVAGLALLGGAGFFVFLGDTPTPAPTVEPVKPPVVSTLPEPVSPPPGQPLTPPPEAVPPPTLPPPTLPPHTLPPATTLPPVATQPPNVTPALPPSVVPPTPSLPPVALVPPPTVIPATPPATLPPVTPQANSSDAIRPEVAAFISRLPCSMLDGDVRDGTVEFTGIARRTAVDDLRQKLTAIGLTSPAPLLHVAEVDQVFCPIQDLLRPIAKTFGDGGDRMTMRLPGDPVWLRKDDYIRPRLTMADFRGEMRVDYLDRDGNVRHLYPQRAEPGEHLAGDPPHKFNAGEALDLGDPGPNNRGWQVSEPFGTDVIVAIASEDALFDRPRPSNVEKASDYLRDLQRAVEAARSRGVRLAATAMAVETRLK
jgi:serine/threonine-protein kinase